MVFKVSQLSLFPPHHDQKSSKHKKKKQKKEKEEKEKKKKKKHHHHHHHSDGGGEDSVQNGTVEEEEPLPVSGHNVGATAAVDVSAGCAWLMTESVFRLLAKIRVLALPD